jgi:hypothetical protein
MVIILGGIVAFTTYLSLMFFIKCPKETSVEKPSKKLISTVNSITQKLFEGTWIDKSGNFKKNYNTSFMNNQGIYFISEMINGF